MTVLITGGAGFIGTNAALAMLDDGHDVIVFDSLVRPGTLRNLATLKGAETGNRRFRFIQADVADQSAVEAAVDQADIVLHLAAQVSVTGGVRDPAVDFRSNMIGTFNVLEAARRSGRNPIVLVASTNKVYGTLNRFRYAEQSTRWMLPDRPYGIAEEEPFDLVTPYACSKGAADLGVRAIVFRQSCIYGPHQQASEEQAWVAWFIKAALADQQILIFGDGKQVRDVLHVDDLVAAYRAAISAIDRTAGKAFNLGGGPTMTVSIWSEFGDWLSNELGRAIAVSHRPARPGDQRVFISDTRRAMAEFGWEPRIKPQDGFGDLVRWLKHADSRL
jgi:CDP-paratose 2-epimerase